MRERVSLHRILPTFLYQIHKKILSKMKEFFPFAARLKLMLNLPLLRERHS